jgi:hypothetical protein
MVADVVEVHFAVSGWVALRRAAIGAGLAVGACVTVTLLGHPVGAFLTPTVVVWAIIALYSGFDRGGRPAAAAAGATAALVWFGAAPMLGAGPAGTVTRAALGILAASQIYAAVTRLGQDSFASKPVQDR